jgi:tRNA(Ile2) C34 agmatinyltransferase TiaS
MIKELKTLLQKYFGTLSPKPLKIKKPTPVKVVEPQDKLNSLVEEIGKDMLGIRVRVEWGRCPYCESITQMLSTRVGYFRCSTCREITKQYVNGHIAYLPVDDPHVLGDDPQA